MRLLATLEFEENPSGVYPEPTPTFCNEIVEPLPQEDSFVELCSCGEDSLSEWVHSVWNDDESTWDHVPYEECRWTGVRNYWNDLGLCFATAFPLASCHESWENCYGGTYLEKYPHLGHTGCWLQNPSGMTTITILNMVVALLGQFVEAITAFREFKHPQLVPVLMTSASVFQSVGVVVSSAVLLTRPGFAKAGYWNLHPDEKVLTGFVAFAMVAATLGSLAEVLSCYYLKSLSQNSESTSGPCLCGTCQNAIFRWLLNDNAPQHRRIHRLGVFGNAAVWLGLAVFEVTATTFLVWKSNGLIANLDDSDYENRGGDWGVFTSSLASLLVVEVVALVSMWAAKRMWNSIKLRVLEEDLPRKSMHEFVRE